MKKKTLSLEEQISEYITYWQVQLRLVDWNITFQISTDTKEGYGCMKHNPHDQQAEMTILDPSVIPSNWGGCRDIEVTVVHELIHTRFLYCIPRNKKSNVHEEFAIEVTAKALVANRRGITPEDLI